MASIDTVTTNFQQQPVASGHAVEASSPKETAVQVPVVEKPEIDLDEALDEIKIVIEEINRKLVERQHSIQFSVDESIDKSIITVVDKSTGQVVRQLPTEEMLRFSRNIENMKGLLIQDWI